MDIPCGPDRDIKTLTQAMSIAQEGDTVVLDATPEGYEMPEGGMPNGISVVAAGKESISLHPNRRDIARGYSGGPILNPVNGQVLGIVRALIDPERAAAAYGIATPDLSIGPGIAPLRAILPHDSRESDDSDDIFTRARKATVHVFCWQ